MTFDPTPSYYIALSDEERKMIELQSENFHQATGRAMAVPPRLYDDLKRGGVRMNYIIADPALEGWGDPEGFDAEGIRKGLN